MLKSEGTCRSRIQILYWLLQTSSETPNCSKINTAIPRGVKFKHIIDGGHVGKKNVAG
uniref:Uncharacterized protein n=1 Tax=Physcomitrium patens TaxID=3218 RepID=A0A2K1JXQ5_PHYPA|nr:hypothetical protein PHYPA_013425 [Physcomitrium patens]